MNTGTAPTCTIGATVVGKPRQEDFFIGDLLQELLSPLFPLVMPAVEQLWSYGETGYPYGETESPYGETGIRTEKTVSVRRKRKSPYGEQAPTWLDLRFNHLAGWLAGWQAVWLAGRPAGWLAGWLAG